MAPKIIVKKLEKKLVSKSLSKSLSKELIEVKPDNYFKTSKLTDLVFNVNQNFY
jgi:hypothetical protein